MTDGGVSFGYTVDFNTTSGDTVNTDFTGAATGDRDLGADDCMDAGEERFFGSGHCSEPDERRRFAHAAGIGHCVEECLLRGGGWVVSERCGCDAIAAIGVRDCEHAHAHTVVGVEAGAGHDTEARGCAVHGGFA